MPELLARDTLSSHRWRRRLVPNQPFVVGRSTKTFPVYWDKQVSSKHAHLIWNGTRLEISKFDDAVNPIFFDSRPCDTFHIDPGQHFVIGHTEFLLRESTPTMPMPHRSPQTEVTIRPEEIRRTSFRQTPGRIEMLTEMVSKMTASTDHEQLITITLQQLLCGIPHATDVLLLEKKHDGESSDFYPVAWDSRDGESTPSGTSHTLIENATNSQMCVLHVWPHETESAKSEFTMIAGHDWAMCIPIQIKLQQQAAIYISGQRARLEENLTEVELLQDDIKFAELVGSTFANLSRNMALERRQSQLNQFFTPGLLDHVSTDLETFLAPREADLMVLFCDLRGFSSAAEEHFDRLIPYLQQTSETLSEITSAILAERGVIGDFHGDAVMGFWGWPAAALENPLGCIQAATQIAEALAGPDFLTTELPPKAGIGIASGRGVAGMIGSRDQVKVTAFGPTVNLASRIEGLTKPLGVPLLLDEHSVNQLNQHPGMSANKFLRLGWFRLAGLKQKTQIFTFVAEELPWLESFSDALESFDQGRWTEAIEMLQVVSDHFGPKHFLLSHMAKHQNRCPADWKGTIERHTK
ncbi:hypothetical protein GC197_14835 [bacterium]|nr:hypothetical protein [bacterium]